MQPESAVARVHGEPRHGMIAREKALAKRFSGISWFLAFSSSSPREPANIVFDQGRRRKGKTTETICQTDLRVQDVRRAGPARQKTPFSGLESTRMSSSTQHSGDGMFYSKITANENATPWPNDEIALRHFIAEHSEALAHSATLLAGRTGARIVSDIIDGLSGDRPLTRRLRLRLFELRGILALEHAHDDVQGDADHCAFLDPEDPVIDEICLLTDQYGDALAAAGLADPRGMRAPA